MTSHPADRRYSREHEWVRVEGDRATIGITDYAQNQLGDVVFLELPEVGRALKTGEVFGTVESVKAVSELYAPVSGEVVEVNAALARNPEKINGDPYGEGWMVTLRLHDVTAVASLLDADAYAKHVEQAG
jgi:glycine cleavage system H protein